MILFVPIRAIRGYISVRSDRAGRHCRLKRALAGVFLSRVMDIWMAEPAGGANADWRLEFAGKSRVGEGHWPGIVHLSRQQLHLQ